MFSCPGLTSSQKPPAMYFAGLALHLTYKQADVKSVEIIKRPKPSHDSSPRVPATAPAKQDNMNLMVYMREALNWTFGGYRSCAAVSGLAVDMVVYGKHGGLWESVTRAGASLTSK